MNVRKGIDKKQLAYDTVMVDYIVSYGTYKINEWLKALRQNVDSTMLLAAEKAWEFGESLPNAEYYIPESTPDMEARGSGKVCNQEFIKQFGSGFIHVQQETASR